MPAILPQLKPTIDPFYGLTNQQTEQVHYLDSTIERLINQVMNEFNIEPVRKGN